MGQVFERSMVNPHSSFHAGANGSFSVGFGGIVFSLWARRSSFEDFFAKPLLKECPLALYDNAINRMNMHEQVRRRRTLFAEAVRDVREEASSSLSWAHHEAAIRHY